MIAGIVIGGLKGRAMNHEYQTGRSVCGFVEFIAWIGVVVGGLLFITSIGTAFSSRDGILALLGVAPALTLLMIALLIVILVQMARAGMDGSVAAQKNFIQNEKQHAELLGVLRSYSERTNELLAASPRNYEAAIPTKPEPGETPEDTSGHGGRFGVPTSEGGLDRMASDPRTRKLVHREGLILDGDQGVHAMPQRFDNPDDARNFVDRSALAQPAIGASPDVSYRGHKIRPDGEKVRVHGIGFASIEAAKRYIDGIAVDATSAVTVEPDAPTVTEYRGYGIVHRPGCYHVGGVDFGTIEEAKQKVNELIAAEDSRLGRRR